MNDNRRPIVASATTGVPDHPGGLRHIELPVEGLNCPVCIDHVRHALLSVPDVTAATVSPTGLASVTYESSRVSLADLDRAVRQAGYLLGAAEGRIGLVGVY
jgi:copper chaperone CopZ